MMTLRYFFLASIFIIGCKADTKKQTVVPKATEQKAAKNEKLYHAVPNDVLMNVWDNGQMIDYLFHDLPFSMSQDEQTSIRTNLTYIAAKPLGAKPAGCKPMARQFYQVGGDIVLEADIYFDEKCRFYIFHQDGEARWGNYMSESGIQFFNSMIQKAMQARKQIGGG